MTAAIIAGVVFVGSVLSLVLALLTIECVDVARKRRARHAREEAVGDYPFNPHIHRREL